MSEKFFAHWSAAEKAALAQNRGTLEKMITAWGQGYPGCLRPERIPPVALVVALAVPRLPPPQALLVAKLILWIFGVDDAADEQRYTHTDLVRKADDWYQVAARGRVRPDDGDAFTAMLAEIRSELAAARFFELWGETWADHVRRIVQLMAHEYRQGERYRAEGAAALPPLDEYLRTGIYTVGFPVWATLVAILVGEAALVRQFDLVNQAIQLAGAAIRLYNDLQTAEKEKLETKINALVILEHQLSESGAGQAGGIAARQWVRRLADEKGQACRALCARLHTESGQLETAITRIVDFHAVFYSERDYHTTTPADLDHMLA